MDGEPPKKTSRKSQAGKTGSSKPKRNSKDEGSVRRVAGSAMVPGTNNSLSAQAALNNSASMNLAQQEKDDADFVFVQDPNAGSKGQVTNLNFKGRKSGIVSNKTAGLSRNTFAPGQR